MTCRRGVSFLQVHRLRSVDNLFVVIQEFKDYQFKDNKVSDHVSPPLWVLGCFSLRLCQRVSAVASELFSGWFVVFSRFLLGGLRTGSAVVLSDTTFSSVVRTGKMWDES